MAKATEADLWQWISHEIGGLCHLQRHEDKLSVGIPDISYAWAGIDGWIELKTLNHEPPQDEVFDFSYAYFKAHQRNWLTKRARSGNGRVYLACWVNPDTLVVWQWGRVSAALGSDTWKNVKGLADGIIIGHPSWRAWRGVLTGPP